MLPLRKKLIHIAEMANGEQTVLGREICKFVCERLGSRNAKEIINGLDEDGYADTVVEEDDEYISIV